MRPGEPTLSAPALVDSKVTGVRWCDATGLLCLLLERAGTPRRLGIGVGPRVVGVGFLPGLPRFSAARAHPLVAGIRAHFVGRHITAATLDGGDFALSSDEKLDGDASGPVELRFALGRNGRIALSTDGRRIASWPAEGDRPATSLEADELGLDSLPDAGAALLADSDREAESAAWRELERAVRRKHKRLQRRRDAIQGDLDRADEIPALERAGHLLLAHGAEVPRGAREAQIADWETGQPVHIPLDPKQPARAQAAGFFSRARRLKRGIVTMRARLKLTDGDLAELSALDERIRPRAGGPDPEREVTRLWAAATALGIRPSGHESSTSAPKAPTRLPFVPYVGAEGRAILVGRGARDNDTLTVKHARPSDLFLHVQGVTGAHVIVPKAKGEACPSELLVDAATLAAHFSDARGEEQLDVSYVERRYVRKPRKSPAGTVMLQRQKVLRLRFDAKRLARLLATKVC